MNSNNDDEALASLAEVAESVAAAPVETTAESSTGMTTTMEIVVDDTSTPNVTTLEAAAESTTATTENTIVDANVNQSDKEKEGVEGPEAISETMIDTTTTTTTAEEPIAPQVDDVEVTATGNVQTTNNNNINDDAMAESEETAMSMASTALLIDLERRYMDMSTEYQRLKEQWNAAQTTIQQYQQQKDPNDVMTLQNAVKVKDEQIVQLQNQIQTQQETYRLVQEQKDQLQANHDTLQEEIRYVHRFCCCSLKWLRLSFSN
jgi:chromosome segregation ATPase